MAVKKRKTTITNKSAAKTPKRRRGTTVARTSRKKSAGGFANFFVPLFLMVGILACLGFLLSMGYRTVTASAFFDVKAVEINGVSRASKEEIERIVRSQAEKTGVWSADLAGIKSDIEKSVLIKSAVVSRILPDGMRVDVVERVPRAVVRLNSEDFWADDDAVMIGAVGKNDSRPPFVLRGWDEAKSEKAAKDNQERVRVYLKMLNEWKDFDLASRVSIVDLSDARNPQAIVRDSGEEVTIILARENFGKRLQRGLEIIAKKGKEIKAVDLSTSREVLSFREKPENLN
jgi:cell division septal protein FtsQ